MTCFAALLSPEHRPALSRFNRAHFHFCRSFQQVVRDARARFGFRLFILAFAMSGVGCNRTQVARRLDFNQDVQPILVLVVMARTQKCAKQACGLILPNGQ
jgi:hypothetical protein